MVISGAGGQVGRFLAAEAGRRGHDVLGLTSAQWDITDADAAANPYRPPVAEVRDLPRPAERDDALFYVVAQRKFLVLMIGTLGLYAIYWFYRNWSQFNRARRLNYWPVLRAIFAIFFTHSLFGEVDRVLQRERRRYDWSPGGLATLYVASSIVTGVVGQLPRLGGRGTVMVSQLVTWALFAAMVYVLHRAQGAINLACDDADGKGNRALTWPNFAWLALGALMWFVTVVGIIAIFSGRAVA